MLKSGSPSFSWYLFKIKSFGNSKRLSFSSSFSSSKFPYLQGLISTFHSSRIGCHGLPVQVVVPALSVLRCENASPKKSELLLNHKRRFSKLNVVKSNSCFSFIKIESSAVKV